MQVLDEIWDQFWTESAAAAMIGGGIVLAIIAAGQLRDFAARWRAHRQAVRDPFMRTEPFSLFAAQDEHERPPVNWGNVLFGLALMMVSLFWPHVERVYGLPDWCGYLVFGLIAAGGLLRYFWHRLNDPAELVAEKYPGMAEAEIPPEAIGGIIGAVAIVAALIGALVMFF